MNSDTPHYDKPQRGTWGTGAETRIWRQRLALFPPHFDQIRHPCESHPLSTFPFVVSEFLMTSFIQTLLQD